MGSEVSLRYGRLQCSITSPARHRHVTAMASAWEIFCRMEVHTAQTLVSEQALSLQHHRPGGGEHYQGNHDHL